MTSCFVSALAALLIAGTAASPAVLAQQRGGEESFQIQTSDTLSDVQAPTDAVELYRLRIVNRRDGAIQVSSDAGETWRLIGRVLNPATTAAEGYAAAQYMEPGAVAAIAVHGIRLRVGEDNKTLHDPLVLSIDPIEYANSDTTQDPNKGYGGLVTGSAGILTDIPSGTALFRDLSPLVGNRVYLETATGTGLRSLPENFHPQGKGETLVIPVFAPKNSLVEVTFENRRGGKVEGRYATGEVRPLTQVVEPVQGTGRFDGTSYTGVGRLNTNHTGVITVSTAPIDRGGGVPEGEGKERRGGFQIQPSSHSARSGESGVPVVMTIGNPDNPKKRELEATAPLFRGTIGLGDAPSSNDSVPSGEAVVDLAIDGGPWESMPALIGLRVDSFTATGMNRLWKAQRETRVCTKGVTAFRLRLPRRDPLRSRAAILAAASAYSARRLNAARATRLPIVKGVLTVNANPTNRQGVSFVRLSVEGVPHGFTNVAPFALSWDTRTVPDGDYLIEAEAMNESGTVLATTRRRVFVLNAPKDASLSGAAAQEARKPR